MNLISVLWRENESSLKPYILLLIESLFKVRQGFKMKFHCWKSNVLIEPCHMVQWSMCFSTRHFVNLYQKYKSKWIGGSWYHFRAEFFTWRNILKQWIEICMDQFYVSSILYSMIYCILSNFFLNKMLNVLYFY